MNSPKVREAIDRVFEEINNMTQEEFDKAMEEADGSWIPDDVIEGLKITLETLDERAKDLEK